MALTARGEFAPAGWSLQSVELNERKVSARVERDSGGRLDVMNAWLSEQPDLHAKVVPNESTLWLPVTTTLQPWTDKLASAQAHYAFLDSLTGLGWSLVEASAQIKSPTREHQWSLTKAATLSELASLSTLLSNQPASLQTLTLAPLHDGTYRVELTLTYTQRQSKENKT
ncbi:hypothetical protein JCM19233_3080 [Vibrio astriarenae]|nr:hypothetical protein JCM19233_3080 [Vibrio sp. C7]